MQPSIHIRVCFPYQFIVDIYLCLCRIRFPRIFKYQHKQPAGKLYFKVRNICITTIIMPVIWKFRNRNQRIVHLYTLQYGIRTIKPARHNFRFIIDISFIQKPDIFKCISCNRLFWQKIFCTLFPIPQTSIFFCLCEQIRKAVCHNSVPDIGGMINIIKKLVFCKYPPLTVLFIKLRGHRIFYTNHRQVIVLPDRYHAFLQVPVIGKYGKQQYYSRLVRKF